jgi:hypothetical protein
MLQQFVNLNVTWELINFCMKHSLCNIFTALIYRTDFQIKYYTLLEKAYWCNACYLERTMCMKTHTENMEWAEVTQA